MDVHRAFLGTVVGAAVTAALTAACLVVGPAGAAGPASMARPAGLGGPAATVVQTGPSSTTAVERQSAAAAPGRAAAIADLKAASRIAPVAVLDARSGTVTSLSGRWPAPAAGDGVAGARAFLAAYAPAFGLRAAGADLRSLSATRDALTGGRDVVFGQSVAGVPVWNATVTVHFDPAGAVTGVSGDTVAAVPATVTPALDRGAAVACAAAAVDVLPPAGEPLSRLPRTAVARADDVAATASSAPALVLYPDQAGRLHLAYSVDMQGAGPLDVWQIIVDARDGAVLARVPLVRTAAGSARGYGIDLYGKKVALNDYRTSAGGYKLVDRTQYMFRNHKSAHPYTTFQGCIEVRDARHIVDAQGQGIPSASYPTVTDKNKDNFFNHGGADDKANQRSAVSLALNLAATYKAVRSSVGRNSLDGNGIAVIGNVHIGKAFENAYWQPQRKMMFFGDNKDTAAPYAKSLDIVAHEFGHGVTQYSVKPDGLVYMYPSGAIDESISDSWGCVADYKDWLIGEDLGKASRDLVTPANGDPPLPASMYEYNLLVLPVDGGGNHINCGVGGHFFQQLSAALPAAPPAADGRYTAARIVTRAYTYLDATSSFRDWAIGLRRAASDLYGASSAQAAATHQTLQQLGMGYLDVEQNDNGWCADQSGALQWVMFGYGVSSDYLCVKFHRPAGAQLYRAYAALDPGAKPSAGTFHMYVVGVNGSGGPDPDNIIFGRDVDMNGILPLGNFTPIQVTSGGQPAAIDVPSDYFICIGYTDSTSPYDYGVLLTDDGTTPTDTSWWLHYDVLSQQWQEQLFHTMSGRSGVNFMLRPMYSYANGPA